MVELGFFVYNDYYGQEGKEGHIEIAHRILSQKPAWRNHFELQARTKWKDPVDFLVFVKGAVKIGNRWGARVVTYSSAHMDKEMLTCLMEYKARGWKLEDVALLR